MSWLAAGVIADLDMTLVELHCNMIIVSIVQQNTIILSCRHLQRENVFIGSLNYSGFREAVSTHRNYMDAYTLAHSVITCKVILA